MLRNHSSHPLLSSRGRGYRHAMTAEDVHHLLTVGRAAGGGSDHFSSFAEICRAHYRWGYEGELFHILAAEVIEAVHCASGYAKRLPGSVRDDG
jgi:hypothetical protein